MSSGKRIKIQIRPVVSRSAPLKINARERAAFLCGDCGNKYYSFYYFCPQCLGRVRSHQKVVASLKIIAVPPEKEEAVAHLLKLLSANDTDFEKCLHSLPWTVMEESDPAILEEWKAALETENAAVEILTGATVKGQKKKPPPLYKSQAPLPFFFPSAIESGVRGVSKNIRNMSIRIKWVDAVSRAFRIIEGFYKQDPAGRILFSDFLFELERQLQDAIRDHNAYYRSHEEEFVEVIDKIQHSVENKEVEIQSVRKQIEEQL